MRVKSTLETDLVTARGARQINARMNAELGERHHRKRVPRHFAKNRFTNPNSGAYGYFRRTIRTQEAKVKKGQDPLRPNYATGELFRAIMGSSKVRKTSTRWSWQARAHRKMTVTQRREIEAHAPEERKENIAYRERRFPQLAKQAQYRRKRKRRS
ncbi:hypothetical protein KOR42_39380 [Thalassoglobus neptunius]|uniref:Uncharacterized protein n=1 Tax=Thalassoglobus neptunius TaxID=1938619 RepID=A0A5C5WGV1_9PLAN|nr:hypothetical protein [Thalassoglobus neptunius]TWT49022.1 hypothetical protein KOR42_39380 [Thalassoglobus neptunius]